jgi:hypothetical protein
VVPSQSDENDHRHAVTIFAAEKVTEQRNGGYFTVDEIPDLNERNLRAIDLIGHDSLGIICLEHTLIEAYEGQRRETRQASRLMERMEERFKEGLDRPGPYVLALDTGGVNHLRDREIDDAVDRIEKWVRRQNLPVPEVPPPIPNHVRGEPPDTPVLVTLFRLISIPDDGKFTVSFQRDESTVTPLRVDRIRRALSDKAGKLEISRTGEATTVLVFELNDYMLSGPGDVMSAVYEAAQSIEEPLPDHIIMIDVSSGDGSWMAYYTKIGSWWARGPKPMSH